MMDQPFETIEYKGFQIKLFIDYDPPNPREWDNLGKMLCHHRRYALGDEEGRKMTTEEIVEYVSRKDVVSLPLYLLDHSGLWMKTSRFWCDPGGWDTSHVGYITATHDRIKEWFGKKRMTKKLMERALRVLEMEVKAYSAFLEGDVIGYTIERDGEVVDSCWGFFPEFSGESGSFVYLIEECQAIIDRIVEEEDRVAHIAGSVTSA